MKKFFLMAMFFMPFLMNAQQTADKFLVKAQVIDSISSETMPYTTCSVVLESKPQQVVSRFVSDVNGNINGELKAPGRYILYVTSVGKSPSKRSFSIDAKNRQVQLGKIAMGNTKQTLKEVSVVAARPLIKAEADKISYDTEQDPEAKSSTALEILRKVPMVTVDGQDNIQLKGASNFKFFLNGKPTNMFDNNPGQILKSFPANMISKIEVITQPGAKYDAEGVGGIINIVTVQQASTQGYSVTLNSQVTSRGSYGGGANVMLQTGKISFSGYYNYMYNKQFPVTTSSERHSYVENAPYAYGKQFASVENPTPMQFGNGQLTYELDTANLFTFSFNRHYGRPKSTTTATTDDFADHAALNEVFGYEQNSVQQQTWGSTELGLDYQHSFKKKGENLTFSYKLSNTPNSSNYEATNIINPKYITSPQEKLAQWNQSNNDASTNEHTFQLDYSNPIAKGHTIEMGAKYIARLNDSKSEESFSYFDFSKPYPYQPYHNVDTTTQFKNNQDILGVYATYSGSIGKWGWNGGVRYEYTWIDVKFNDKSNFSPNYGVIVPSATFTYKLSDMQSIKLGYNMRIQRPSIDFLNPYVNRRDPNYINYGNPNLDPEKSHNITLGYSNFAPKYNVSAELTYTFVNNAIEQFSFIERGKTIQEMTYANIGHNKQVNLNLFGNYRGWSWLTLYTNANIGYTNMESSDRTMKNDGFTGRFFAGGTFMLPKDFRISTGGGGNLSQITLQGKQSEFFFSYIAFSKDLLDKRLNLSLSAVYLPKSHIILTTKGVNSISGTETFNQRTDIHLTKTTEIRFNVSYRIGSLNVQMKKTKATISNDDQKLKDNSSAGQSPM